MSHLKLNAVEGTRIPSSTVKDMKLISLSQRAAIIPKYKDQKQKWGIEMNLKPIQRNRKYNGNPSSQTLILTSKISHSFLIV